MRTLVCFVALLFSCGKTTKQEPHADPTPAAAATTDARPPTHEDRNDPVASAPVLTLEVTIAGTKTTWQHDVFDKTPKLPGKNRSGEGRDVWSLRALVDQMVGPGARVVTVTGDGATNTIAPEAWGDPTRTPILHTTRRGTLKFRWASKDGEWEETTVRDVTKLEIVR